MIKRPPMFRALQTQSVRRYLQLSYQTFTSNVRRPALARLMSNATTTDDADIHRISPQLDMDYLANHTKDIAKNMQLRNYDTESIYRVKELYTERAHLRSQVEQLNEERDRVNKLIRTASSKAERSNYITQAKEWKDQIRQIEENLTRIENELITQALQVPNNTHPDVPLGAEENAKVIKIIGDKRTSTAPLLDHVAIANQLDMVDFEQASFISGSKFYYLKNYGVWLEFALIQYAMQKAAAKGFSPVLAPDIVRTSVAYGCGFQPRKKEASQIYDVTTASMADTPSAPKMCLVGTAEIPLAGLSARTLLNEEELPKRIVGFSHAFRAEAGHGSAEERGLYRVHQFSKVELFVVTTPEQSEAMLDEMKALQEEMFTDLGLCFRILDMPTEELGASAYRKYDMEAWMPGKNGWGEISSTSNCTDYQTRRLDIRYLSKRFKEEVGIKDVRVPWSIKEKYVHYCHTLNGTAMAVPRIIIALLETHQNSDGTVNIPEPLRKWIPGEPKIIK